MVETSWAWRGLVLLCGGLIVWGLPALVWSQDRASVTEAKEIELPSIEIYGERKVEFVTLGEKRAALESFTFPVYLPPKTRETGDIEKMLDVSSKRFIAPEPGHVPDGLWALDVEVGSFLHHKVGVKYGNQRKKASYMLDLQHQMGQGHVDSSAYRGEAIGVQRIWGTSPNTSFALDLGFQDGTYQLWGGATSKGERKTRGFHTQGEAIWFFPRSTDLAFGALLEHQALSDSSVSTTEYQLETYGAIQSVWRTMLVQSQTRYQGGFLDQDGDKENNRLVAVEVSGRLTFSRFGMLLGLSFFNVQDYYGKGKNRVYPQLELSYLTRGAFRATLFYHPQMTAGSFKGGYVLNPFIELDAFLPYQDKSIAGGMELGLHLGEAVISRVEASYEEQAHFPVWIDPDSNGVWEPQQNGRVQNRRLLFDLVWQPVQRFRWEVSGGLQKTDFLSADDKGSEVPYVPDFFLDSQISVGLFGGLMTQLRGRYTAERLATASGEKLDLDAYSLVDVQLSKTWGKHLRFLLGGRNLLDQTYMIWQGYEMPRVTGYIGLEGRW